MMHKLPLLATLGGYQGLTRIDRSAVQFLWHSSFWDYSQSGMLLYSGEKCWFQVIEENEGNEWFRRFLVIRLTAEQLQEEESWHELFRQKVGTHTDYDANEKRQVNSLKPQDTWDEFYGPCRDRQPLDLSGNPAVGWFEV